MSAVMYDEPGTGRINAMLAQVRGGLEVESVSTETDVAHAHL